MKNVWVSVVVSLALACPTAYAVQDMMPEEGPAAQEQEMAKPAKAQGAAHHKHKRHKKQHHAKKHPRHKHHAAEGHEHKHHAKKHHMAPEGQETPAEQKIDEETDLNNSRR